MKARSSRGAEWVVGQFALLALLIISGLVKRGQWPAQGSRAAGATLLGISAIYALLGIGWLRRNLTPFPEPKINGELVTSGIFAYVRHPLYASLIAVGFGWALLCRSWPSLLLAVAQAIFLREKAKNEETRLKVRFPAYPAYAQRVPRFIPALISKTEKAQTL